MQSVIRPAPVCVLARTQVSKPVGVALFIRRRHHNPDKNGQTTDMSSLILQWILGCSWHHRACEVARATAVPALWDRALRGARAAWCGVALRPLGGQHCGG